MKDLQSKGRKTRVEQTAVPGWGPGRGGIVWASIIKSAEVLQDNVSLRKDPHAPAGSFVGLG